MWKVSELCCVCFKPFTDKEPLVIRPLPKGREEHGHGPCFGGRDVVKAVSCGCCDHGCICINHMDIPHGLGPQTCGIHQLVSHPKVTGLQRVWIENEIPPVKLIQL